MLQGITLGVIGGGNNGMVAAEDQGTKVKLFELTSMMEAISRAQSKLLNCGLRRPGE